MAYRLENPPRGYDQKPPFDLVSSIWPGATSVGAGGWRKSTVISWLKNLFSCIHLSWIHPLFCTSRKPWFFFFLSSSPNIHPSTTIATTEHPFGRKQMPPSPRSIVNDHDRWFMPKKSRLFVQPNSSLPSTCIIPKWNEPDHQRFRGALLGKGTLENNLTKDLMFGNGMTTNIPWYKTHWKIQADTLLITSVKPLEQALLISHSLPMSPFICTILPYLLITQINIFH